MNDVTYITGSSQRPAYVDISGLSRCCRLDFQRVATAQASCFYSELCRQTNLLSVSTLARHTSIVVDLVWAALNTDLLHCGKPTDLVVSCVFIVYFCAYDLFDNLCCL